MSIEDMFAALKADVESEPMPEIDPFAVADKVLGGGSDE